MKRRPGQEHPYIRRYPRGALPGLQMTGLLMILSGLLLLFLCVPGWAWAAMAGILLILAGYVLLRMNDRWR